MKNEGHKQLVVVPGCSITSPPLTATTRRRVGHLLRAVQRGEAIGMPLARSMPSIGPGVFELRLSDEQGEWRVIYHVGARRILVVDAFKKTTQQTPKGVIDRCRRRLAANPE